MRLGLIGPGRWGSNYLKPENGGERIGFVLGNHESVDGLDTVKSHPHCPTNYWITNNWTKFLDFVDAVIIATPPHLHPEHVLRCFEAGKDVLCEKPLALTRAEWSMLLNEASKRGRRLAVAYTHLCSESFVMATGEQSTQVRGSMWGDSNHHQYSALLDWGCHAVSMAVAALGELGLRAKIQAIAPRQYYLELGDSQAELTFGHSEREKWFRFIMQQPGGEQVYEPGKDRIPALKVLTDRFAENRLAALESLEFHDDIARILFG